MFFFFFKLKTAYEMRISDWSSDVCSSDLKIHSPQYGTEKRPTSLPQACRYPSSDVRPESNHTGAPAYISCNNSLINARYGESSLRRWLRITGEVACSSDRKSTRLNSSH